MKQQKLTSYAVYKVLWHMPGEIQVVGLVMATSPKHAKDLVKALNPQLNTEYLEAKEMTK